MPRARSERQLAEVRSQNHTATATRMSTPRRDPDEREKVILPPDELRAKAKRKRADAIAKERRRAQEEEDYEE